MDEAYIDAFGNVTVTSGFYQLGTSANIRFRGTAAVQDFDLTGVTNEILGHIHIDKTSGEVKLLSDFQNYDNNASLYFIDGVLNLNGFTLDNNYNNYANYVFVSGDFEVSGTGSFVTYKYQQTAGTFQFSGLPTFTVENELEMQAGIFIAGASTLDINGTLDLWSGATFNSTSNSMYMSGTWDNNNGGTFNHNNGTLVFDGSGNNIYTPASGIESFFNLTVDLASGTLYLITHNHILQVNGDLNLIGGTFASNSSINEAYFDVYGNVTVSSTFNQLAISGNIRFRGTASVQEFDLSGVTNEIFGHIHIDKSSGQVKMMSDFVNAEGNASLYFIDGTLNLNSKTIDNNYSNYANNIYVSGDFDITGMGSIETYKYVQTAATFQLSGMSTFIIQNELEVRTGTFTSGSASIDLNGTLDLWNGATFNATSNSMNMSGTWDNNNGGTFNHNNGTVIYDGTGANIYTPASGIEIFNNLTVNLASGTLYLVTHNDILQVNGDLNLIGGTFASNNSSNEAYLDVYGDVTVTSGFNQLTNSANIRFKGSAAVQDFNLSGVTNEIFGHIHVDKTTGEMRLVSNFVNFDSYASFYLTSGSMNLNGYTLDNYYGSWNYLYVSSDFTISGTGTIETSHYQQTGGTLTISGASTLHIYNQLDLQNGTMDAGNATIDLDNTLVIGSSATLIAPTGTFYVGGQWTNNNGGSFDHNGGMVILEGTSGNLYIPATDVEVFNDLEIAMSSGTRYMFSNDTLRVLGSLSLSSGTIASNNSADESYIKVCGNVDVEPAFNSFSNSMNLIFINSASQYFDLTGAASAMDGNIYVNKTGGYVNLLSALTINASQFMILEEGTFDLNGNNLTLNGTCTVQDGGNLQLQGGETISSVPSLNSGSIVTYDGTVGPYSMKNWSYMNLTIKGGTSTQFTLPTDLTIPETLTFTSGLISTGSYTLYINNTGSVSRTNGHVIGNFKKYISTGGTNKTFEIGDASNYTPVSVAFGNVTVAGDLTIKTTAGDHSNIGSSSLNSSKSVNRYWTFTNSGISFNIYSATLTFVAADLDAGVNTSSLLVGQYESSTWTYPSVGTKTSTSTQATAITGFGDFQLAEAPEKTWDGGALTNNWGDDNNWNPDGVPGSGNNVTLDGANTINVNVAAVCNNLTLDNAGLVLTILNGYSLTVSGNLSLSDGTFNSAASFPSVAGSVNLTGGTFGYTHSGNQSISVQNYPNLAINGSGIKTLAGNITPSGNLSVFGGTLDLGTFTANRLASGGTFEISNGASLLIGGTGSLPANYTTHLIGSASTIEYAGTNQDVATLNSSQYYGNLATSGTGTKTLAGNIALAGDLTISSGTFDLNNYSADRIAAGGTITATTLASGGKDSSRAVYTTASVTPSANKLILLAVGRRGWGAITSVNGNGLNWVQVASDYNGYGEGDNGIVLFRAVGLNPTTGPITITFASAQERANWSVVEFGNVDISGVSGSSAIVQVATSSDTGCTSITAWLSPFASENNASYGAAIVGNTTPALGSGFSKLHLVGPTGTNPDQINTFTEWKTINDTTVDINLGHNPAAIIGVEIKAATDGSLALSNGASLKIGGTGTFPANYMSHSIGSTSTVEYNGSTQEVSTLNSSQNYGHLIISGSGDKTLNGNITTSGNLTINNGGRLIVNAGVNLSVIATLTLNGSECLELKSNTSGSIASLLDGGTINGSGSVRFERYFSQDKWHYFSTPIINASSNSFWGSALYTYNSPTATWQPIGPNVTLQKMTGYDVYYQSNTMVTMSGTPYTGYHSKNLLTGSDIYNFVGNPYPSAIDWDASSGWTKTDVDDAIYIWDPDLGGIIQYVNGIGANGGSRYIPASQGFFVTITNGGPYTLGMNNNVRLHNSVAVRSGDKKENLLRIKINYAESSDEAVIYFSNYASPFFDRKYDAFKMEEANPSRSIIYSKTTDGLDLSINALPELQKYQSIPLYLGSGVAGTYEISISGLENFDMDMNIFLEDLKMRTLTDMKMGNLSFHASPLDEKERFILHVGLPEVLSDIEFENLTASQGKTNHLNTFISRDELVVDLTHAEESKITLYVYNMCGQLLVQKEFHSNGIEKVKMPVQAGYYLLKLVNGNELYTKKILKTNSGL